METTIRFIACCSASAITEEKGVAVAAFTEDPLRFHWHPTPRSKLSRTTVASGVGRRLISWLFVAFVAAAPHALPSSAPDQLRLLLLMVDGCPLDSCRRRPSGFGGSSDLAFVGHCRFVFAYLMANDANIQGARYLLVGQILVTTKVWLGPLVLIFVN